MTSMWKIIWPVLAIALLAPASGWFVENPPYQVSPVHIMLVFLLALLCFYYTVFSSLRHSYGSLTAASALSFLTMASALLPDLWLRWPAMSLLGLGITQLGMLLTYPLVRNTLSSKLIAICGLGLISLLPLVTTVYLPVANGLLPLIAIAGTLMVATGGFYAFLKRQRTTVAGLFTWLFMACITGGLLALVFLPINSNLELRQHAEQYLLYGLMLVGAIFIAELFQVEQQLRSGPHMELEASFRDPLTGLANRRALETYGPRLITQSHEAGRAVSVIITDIDHFKMVNDTHGHQAGDIVLQETAAKLSASVRKSDLVARYGGEEFVIVLPGSPLAPALRLAERIRASLENDTVTHHGRSLTRTASFGVATAFPEEPASLAELIHRADTNLYRAKHEGRNCVMADALPADDF